MKEIDLPVDTTFSLTVDTYTLSSEDAVEKDGKLLITLGSIDMGEKGKDVETARINGGKILYATTSIEKKLEGIISHYIFGLFLQENLPRSFFENEILGSSNFNLAFKKDLVKKIVNQEKFLQGKAKHELDRKLASILRWRNAFAHGRLRYDNVEECVLEYYSNGHKKQILNDMFWDEVVDTYVSCAESLKNIREKIEAPHLQNVGIK